jgi:hypothetical protein
MTFKRLLGIVGVLCAIAVLTGSVGAGAARTPTKHAINLSTNAGIKQYLRSIHVNPKGVVIQRGLRNYAGSSCPGAGWTCTSTSHPVVQVASTGGRNVFQCASSSCAVVQTSVATLATTTNTAKCIKTTGISQSCSITQTSATANNEAIVVQTASKLTGLTQNAFQTAQITQTASGGSAVANSNTACVLQTTAIDGSTAVLKKGMPVTVTLDAHQSITIKQDSLFGGNTVKNASASGGGMCDGAPLTQDQSIISKASGSGAITQKQNAAAGVPNMLIDIKQNQSSGFLGSATGQNTSAFHQTSNLTAVANTPAGPVTQTQSSLNGGLQATVNQFSQDNHAPGPANTSTAIQDEVQCEHAQASGTQTCNTPNPPTYTFTQTQYGPVRCCSEQANDPDDLFTITQSSTQDNDLGQHQNQSNNMEADCSTSGTCTATQTTDVNGVPSSNTQTGSDVSIATTCTGSACTTSNDQSATSVSNTDVAEFGYGGMRGDGTGMITVGGVSGTVTKALLYWNGPTSSTVPTANAAVTFAGIPITGTNIGFASSNCWGGPPANFTNSQSYRADVTPLVTGDGDYSLGNFTKPDADINGVALIVFYDNGDTADDRNVVLFNGNDSNVASTFDPQGWDETIPNVPYPGSGSASLDFVVSDGQTFNDAALVVNGITIEPAGQIFDGDSTPAGTGGVGDGSLWDVESFDMTSVLTNGSNNLHLTSGTAGDCLSLVVAAANVPASAPPIILSPLAAVQQRSQATEMQSTPARSPRRALARPSAQGSRALGGIASLPLRRGRSG